MDQVFLWFLHIRMGTLHETFRAGIGTLMVLCGCEFIWKCKFNSLVDTVLFRAAGEGLSEEPGMIEDPVKSRNIHIHPATIRLTPEF